MSVAIAHKIRVILSQCETTNIGIGHTVGHFLSTKQIEVLKDCVSELLSEELADDFEDLELEVEPKNEPSEGEVRARRFQVGKQVRAKERQLITLPKSERSAANIELGELLSERARLDKLIRVFDQAA